MTTKNRIGGFYWWVRSKADPRFDARGAMPSPRFITMVFAMKWVRDTSNELGYAPVDLQFGVGVNVTTE